MNHSREECAEPEASWKSPWPMAFTLLTSKYIHDSFGMCYCGHGVARPQHPLAILPLVLWSLHPAAVLNHSWAEILMSCGCDVRRCKHNGEPFKWPQRLAQDLREKAVISEQLSSCISVPRVHLKGMWVHLLVQSCESCLLLWRWIQKVGVHRLASRASPAGTREHPLY